MAVLSRLIKVSALVLGAGLVVTGCGPVKMGAAAIVGDQRITVATLDNEVTNLSSYLKVHPSPVPLTPVQQTQQTLSWLIRFQINEELAKQEGITVSAAQAEQAWNEIFKQAEANAQAQGITQPCPGRQRDPAEHEGRGRPVPGHRRPVRGEGQRGHAARHPG